MRANTRLTDAMIEVARLYRQACRDAGPPKSLLLYVKMCLRRDPGTGVALAKPQIAGADGLGGPNPLGAAMEMAKRGDAIGIATLYREGNDVTVYLEVVGGPRRRWRATVDPSGEPEKLGPFVEEQIADPERLLEPPTWTN